MISDTPRTRGEGGVKKGQIFADVLYGWPLRYFFIQIIFAFIMHALCIVPQTTLICCFLFFIVFFDMDIAQSIMGIMSTK